MIVDLEKKQIARMMTEASLESSILNTKEMLYPESGTNPGLQIKKLVPFVLASAPWRIALSRRRPKLLFLYSALRRQRGRLCLCFQELPSTGLESKKFPPPNKR